ncbi:MAG: DnaB-like helicase C-terminal domain-containing protein [Planctomycetota bacterium]
MTTKAKLARDKHDQERLFAACAMSAPDIALEECSWLPESAFTDRKLGDFWRDIKDHGDAIKAANDHGLVAELAGWLNKVGSVLRPDVYARGIAEHKYFLDVLSGNSEIAKAALGKNQEQVKQMLGELQTSDIHKPVELHTGSTLNRELSEVLDGNVKPYVKTYIGTVDKALGGLYGGDLFMLAGRPGTGKTAFTTVCARNAAFSGKTVYFFSVEMRRTQLWGRMVCGHAGYKWRDVRVGNIDDAGKQKIRDLSEKIQRRLGNRLVIYDEVDTVSEIVQVCARGKPDFVIIDHLGEINWENPNDKEVRWYGEAAKLFRAYISKRLNIPLVLVHQLSRDVEGRPNKRPKLHDLRWSGELEQRSDVVGFLYREDMQLDDVQVKQVPCELIIRKNRQGESNMTIMMEYDLAKQDFKSWVEQ